MGYSLNKGGVNVFLAWIWEALGGECKYDTRSIVIRFIFFDLYCWIFIAYGTYLFLLGKLD